MLCVFAEFGGPVQYVVHDRLVFVERVHVQVQDGHQATVQRGEQRCGPDRLLRAGQETAPERVVGQQRGPTRRADIRAPRKRLVLHTVVGEQRGHFADDGQRADRKPFVRDRAPHIDFGKLPSDHQPVLN